MAVSPPTKQEIKQFIKKLGEREGAVVIECANCGLIAGADFLTWEALWSCAIENPRIDFYLCQCKEDGVEPQLGSY